MLKYILFDLDGTLTDSFTGVSNAIMYALKKSGYRVPDRAELKPFMGPPLPESFMKYFGMTQEQAMAMLADYRVYYAEKGWAENAVYAGIPRVLDKLKKSGYGLLVATSKPEYFSRKIIEHFSLDAYFDFIAGATLDNSRNEKADVIAHALASLGISAAEAIMVGDRRYDVIGAKQIGLRSIGVLYGYGDENELRSAGADFIAETPEDIIACVKNAE